MNDDMLKALINKDMTIRIGDRVEVLRGPKEEDKQDGVYYTSGMVNKQGKTCIVLDVWDNGRRVQLGGSMYTWIPEWLRKVES